MKMPETTFVIASKNKGKIKEFYEILSEFNPSVVPMQELGINIDVEENGETFEENALIKAREISKYTNSIVIADDSGLEIEFLNGAPGIYTARFAGLSATDEQKNLKVLDLLKDVPYEKRGARFVCCIAVVFPDKSEFTVRGICNGYIHDKLEGSNGFGYDPIFYLPEFQRTTAQLEPANKHEISHRGKALREMLAILRRHL